EFLLCTDGITRHISDAELRQLLVLNDDLNSVCEELKERCYERGAEDNLTVVLVRVGKRIAAHERIEELEPTVTPDSQNVIPMAQDGNQTVIGGKPEGSFIPASRIAFPAPASESQPVVTQERLNVADPTVAKTGSGAAKLLGGVLVLVLLV